MKQLFIAFMSLLTITLLSGCMKSLKIESPTAANKVTLDADDFNFQNNSPVKADEPYMYYFSQEDQAQFHLHIRRVVDDMVLLSASGTGQKASIIIDKGMLHVEFPPANVADFIPVVNLFTGWAADKKYTAKIDGYIELRNKRREVISRKAFHVESIIKERANSNSEMEEFGAAVANKALASLQEELTKQAQQINISLAEAKEKGKVE